ncbi:helix-turn-helix domain-containing protein [Methylobacillus sp. Pita1]|uniref:helix-turn-helix domain-containing protein n=1 Tax=Methylobacillus sp. Pita1 TaxID=3382642 RepID=UPI0038B5B448
MRQIEYFDECKKKLGITSNYALAKALDLSESRVSDYYKGRHTPDNYACFKIAETLEIDPAVVIAEISAENEKNEKKREFFKVFRGACGKAAAGIILVLGLSFSLLNVPGDGAAAVNGSLAAGAAAALFYYRRYFA